jgi:hypothetical protein
MNGSCEWQFFGEFSRVSFPSSVAKVPNYKILFVDAKLEQSLWENCYLVTFVTGYKFRERL